MKTYKLVELTAERRVHHELALTTEEWKLLFFLLTTMQEPSSEDLQVFREHLLGEVLRVVGQ